MASSTENRPRLRVSAEDDAPAVAAAVRDGAGGDVDVVEVGPTGAHGLDPLVLVTRAGRTAFHANCTPERASALAETARRALPTDDAHAVVEHDADASALPTPGTGPLGVGRRRVLRRCGWVAPDDASALEARVAERGPDEVVDAARSVGLLGRGRGDARADAPVAAAWETARGAAGDPVVVVNGNESDPRNRTDRTLLGGDPLAVLDAALAVARVVGATETVVYLPESDGATARRVEAAAATLDGDRRPEVAVGPDRYIAGEPTMALESLEGNDRLEARLRPPSPAEHGLHGRPTVVHTPRTLAQVRELLRRPGGFDPDAADPGTRLVTVGGDVDAPATVELPTAGSLAAVRDAVSVEGTVKMACVGGQFGGFTRSLERPPAAPALAPDLGTDGAVELLNERRCAVGAAGARAKFAAEENCGRCVPCREGSTQLTALLREVYDGTYRDDALRELARVVRGTSTCEFGRAAARPVTTAMDEFETEFRAHADGRCPSGACTDHP